MAIQEKQLGQSRPTNTTATSIYSPGSGVTGVAKVLVICNTSSAVAKYRLFHDDSGTTYDETTALAWDTPVQPGETKEFDSFMPGNDSSGNYAVRSDTANALTFTLYGAEIT